MLLDDMLLKALLLLIVLQRHDACLEKGSWWLAGFVSWVGFRWISEDLFVEADECEGIARRRFMEKLNWGVKAASCAPQAFTAATLLLFSSDVESIRVESIMTVPRPQSGVNATTRS